jgi:hypothetical protein|tara:strand:+ start:298 stop:603 length:306 start_codon:yes stop_codon:yes gene_type:complete
MSTNVRVAYRVGSGPLVDSISSVTISGTRIRGINTSGIGTFLFTGVATDVYGNTKGSNIKFTTLTGDTNADIGIPERGVYMASEVFLSAPTSTATATIFYG